MPEFARKRPIRAVLLATAVCAISYSLARHHDQAPFPAASGPVQATQQQEPPASAATSALSTASGSTSPDAFVSSRNASSSDAWNPPVGVDRSHEALDRLTLDLTAPPQTLHPASGFRAEPHFDPPPAEAEQPAEVLRQSPAQQSPAQPSLAQPSPVQEPPPVQIPDRPETSTTSVPTTSVVPTAPRSAKARRRDDIDQYLWSVYQRSATKRDASGDFTWKDEAAAARLGLVTWQYVIGGMDADFRELLYNLGHAMDADGLSWTILSGFRDDYRQSLASGYKAHTGNSFHGGSRATGGYGHGCAADIEASSNEAASNNAIWRWVDQHGEKFGVYRPMKQIDPAHIQPFGAWHDVALNLRSKDAESTYLPASVDGADAEKPPVTSLVETRSGVSEAQFDCIRSHRGHFRLAGHPGFPAGHMHRALLFHGGRMHRFGRRRLIVEFGGPEKHVSAETVLVADQTGGSAKAEASKPEASNKNRRDAGQHKVADATHAEKRQGNEAAPSIDRARRNAKAQDAKVQDAKGKEAREQAKGQTRPQKVADSKRPQKHAADASEHQARAGHAKANDAKAGPAKAKNHVADRQDASSSASSAKKL